MSDESTDSNDQWEDFKERVFVVVKERGPITTDEVTAFVDRSANPTYGALKHLNWDGHIERDHPDTWYVDTEKEQSDNNE